MAKPSDLQYDIECNYLKEKYLSDIQQISIDSFDKEKNIFRAKMLVNGKLYTLTNGKSGVTYLIPNDENLFDGDFNPIYIYRFSKKRGIMLKMLEKKNKVMSESVFFYNYESKSQFGEYAVVNYKKTVMPDQENKLLNSFTEFGKKIEDYIGAWTSNLPRIRKDFKIIQLVKDSNGNAILIETDYEGRSLKWCDDKFVDYKETILPDGTSLINEVDKYLEKNVELEENEDSIKKLNKKNIG